MKEFSINGKLKVADDLSHQELLQMLYELLGDKIHFTGVTKDITDNK